MAQSSQLRKVKKPLIERRRRERINEYLNELMILVHEATGTNNAKSSSKMEKAEILEMTVEYLRKLHRTNTNGSLSYHRCRPPVLTSPGTTSSSGLRLDAGLHSPTTDDVSTTIPNATGNHLPYDYVSGFSECARQVRRFLLRQQQTGNSLEMINATPNPAINATASLMLWRQLSEHVAVRMRQQLSFSADTPRSPTRQSHAVPEVDSTPDFVTSLPPTAVQFSTGYLAHDNAHRSMSASSRPTFDVSKNGSDSPHHLTMTSSPHHMTSSSAFAGMNTLANNGCEVRSAGLRERTFDVKEEWPSIVFGDVTTGSGVLSAGVDRQPRSDINGGNNVEDSLRMWRPWRFSADENGNYLNLCVD